MHRITSGSRFPLSQCEMLFLHMYSLQFSKKISMMIIFFLSANALLLYMYLTAYPSVLKTKNFLHVKRVEVKRFFYFSKFFLGI